MSNSRFSRIVSTVIAFVLVFAFAMPTTALAVQTEVTVENHKLAGDQPMRGALFIDDVAAPNPGDTLDSAAKVTSAEGVEWEIPVLWVADNLKLATEAQQGRSYLPALVFYLPQGYAIDGSEFTVTLSDSLTELFGGSEVVSVYDAQTGITYILPASLRNFFVSAQQNTSENQSGWNQSSSEASNIPAEESSDERRRPYNRSLIDIYCAQTARDAFSDEDLEFFLDLVLNKLEPQAVELLLDSFPAFRAAADQGQVGREIGLYVYYGTGDKDGIPEHESAPANALAYVGNDAVVDGDTVRYCYIIGIDLSSFAELDDDDNPVRNPTTGKFVLVREGECMTTFENTIVHELFHAVMDDYNRTGMVGATDIRNAVTDEKGYYPTQELEELYKTIHYPHWFIEGTASSVENIYASRYNMFKMLRAERGSEAVFTEFYDVDGLLYNYLNATSDEKDLFFDLGFSGGYDENGNAVDTDQSRYVSGYIATMYLSELAAKKAGESAIVETESTIAISSERLRAGLNSILERMHNGETLDQVVNDLSPVDVDGNKLYTDTNDFEAKFIKGNGVQADDVVNYSGDDASLQFATTFLNYLVSLENMMGQDKKPNGSILMDFGTELQSPLDGSKEMSSDFLQIVESNELVESTVPNEVALAGGGKSESGSAAASASGAAGGVADADASGDADAPLLAAADVADAVDADIVDAPLMAAEAARSDHEVAEGAAFPATTQTKP